MSTSAHISYLDENGCCHFRYHHWDGYPSYLGSLLLSHLSEQERVLSLFALHCNFASLKTLTNAKPFAEDQERRFLTSLHLPDLAWMTSTDDEKFSLPHWQLPDFSRAAKVAKEWKEEMEYTYLFHKEEWFVSYQGGQFYSLPLLFSMTKPLEKMVLASWNGFPQPLSFCQDFSCLLQKSQETASSLLPATALSNDRDLRNLSALLFNVLNKQWWRSGTDQQSISSAQKMTDFIDHPDFPALSTQILSSALLLSAAQLTQPTSGSSEKKKLKAI